MASKHNPGLPVTAIRKVTKGVYAGTYIAVLDDGRTVPRDMCGLGAGRDEWLRKIKFPCDDCGEWFTAGDLARSDVSGCCEDCADAFWCQKCGGHPDDCGGEGVCDYEEEG
jgi:hypothetical protein